MLVFAQAALKGSPPAQPWVAVFLAWPGTAWQAVLLMIIRCNVCLLLVTRVAGKGCVHYMAPFSMTVRITDQRTSRVVYVSHYR